AWVVQKPFGIILFLSDGLLPRHLTAARLYEGGADHQLALDRMPHLALLNNSARDFAVPDAAAAATAFATGQKVNHRTLSANPRGEALPTILDLARADGRGVGLVTTGALTAASTAAFYAHTTDARDLSGIAQQFVAAPLLQVVLGGGAAEFLPLAKGGKRADGRDLLAELGGRGLEVVRTKAELEITSNYRDRGLFGIFSAGPLAYSNQIESGSGQPSLADMVRRAIQCLERNRKGYVLVVDAALVSSAAERNDGERVITETLALDRAIGTAVKYAGAKSLIVAVGKHSTGGMNLNGYPLRQDHGVALLGTSASGQPAITWSTGPNGPPPNAGPLPVPSANPPAASAAALPGGAHHEPAAFFAPSALNTAEDVLAVGVGPGSEKLRGFLENTAVFRLLKEAL
ncbi:MAG TPA: alkaline phosphatase, partial [Chthoniobacteraceae bacterium]